MSLAADSETATTVTVEQHNGADQQAFDQIQLETTRPPSSDSAEVIST